MTKHLSRQELIKAARTEDSSRFRHLDKCNECRDAVDLLRAFDVAGSRQLSSAPEALVEKALNIAAALRRKGKFAAKVASLIFDSWHEPLPVGVRGEAILTERRLRFEKDGIVFDLRAERHANKWSFVGMLAGDLPETHTVLLKVGGRKNRPDSTGVFHWESKRPPKSLMILLNDLTAVTLPELSW